MSLRDAAKAFEEACTGQEIAKNVAARFAKEFSTEEARKKYLHDHPDADPKNHTVKGPAKTPALRNEGLEKLLMEKRRKEQGKPAPDKTQ